MKFRNLLKKALKYVLVPCALVGSIIGIYSINANAFYIDSNGNLVSENLLPNSDNFTLVGSDTTFDVELSTSNYYTFKVYGGLNNSGAFAMWTEDANGNTLETLTRGTSVNSSFTFSPSVNAVKLGIYANNINNANLMLNIGQTSLQFEPYGIWYNEETYETQKYMASLGSIYSLFNNAYVSAYNNSNDDEVTGYLQLDNNVSTLTYEMLPSNIKQYINTWTSSLTDITLRIYIDSTFKGGGSNAELYFNSVYTDYVVTMYSANVTDYQLGISSQYVSLLNNQTMFNTSQNQNTFDMYNDFVWKQIQIRDFGKNHADFSISLSRSNYFYRDGYSKGYNDGVSVGYDDGYSKGDIDGYNSGYNDGISSNLETNGMRTLFNSILSFPVNMIRESFNFEFMGINISQIIMFIVSISIVVFVVRRFKE